MVAKDQKAKSSLKSPPSKIRLPDSLERVLGLVVLFLIPFACTGLLVTSTCFDLCEWLEVQTWTETPATLGKIELETYSGNGYTKRMIRGQFNYVIDGIEYSSDRICLQSGEGFPVSHRQTVRKLEPHIDQPAAVTCYVDPNEPGQAVLLRESDWGHFAFSAMISLIFSSIGFFGVLLVLPALQESRATRNQRVMLPDEPWRWNRSWQQGRISPQDSRSYLIVGVSVWWIIGLLPSAIVSIPELVKGNWFGLCVLIPFLVALTIFFFAVRRYRFSKLFTAGELELSKNYFQIGSSTTVACVFPLELFPNGDVQARLTQWDSGRWGKDRDSDGLESLASLVEGPRIIIPRKQCEIVGDRFRIPIRVSIPADSPCSHELHEDGSMWKLNVKVTTDIGNFAVNFDLPVFDNVGDLELPNMDFKKKAGKGAQLSKSFS